MLQPKRLPRDFLSIIVGVLYHSPGANSSEMLDYLRTSLEHIEANYANCGIILSGDFNKLDFKLAAKNFQLKPIINFPTRGPNVYLIKFLPNLKIKRNLPVS